MPRTFVFFDIDQTLIASEDGAHNLKDRDTSHLRFIEDFILTDKKRYSIYLDKTAELFKYLLEREIGIGFITNGSWPKQYLVKCLELLYQLEKDSLYTCIFINADSFDSKKIPLIEIDKDFYLPSKSAKLQLLKENGVLLENDKVILVDDFAEFRESTEAAGFDFIHATGFLEDNSKIPVSDKYLYQIRASCGFKPRRILRSLTA